MDNVLIGMSFFLALCFGLVSYMTRRRGMIRRRGGSQPMPPRQAGSVESRGSATSGVDCGAQSTFNSPQPPARPGRLHWFKMIAPSRRTKVLLGVATLLFLAGILMAIVTVNLANSPLSLLYIATALIGLGSAIYACLVLAFAFQQGKGQRTGGWPPS
jgi:hypothetical protein